MTGTYLVKVVKCSQADCTPERNEELRTILTGTETQWGGERDGKGTGGLERACLRHWCSKGKLKSPLTQGDS